MADINTTTKIPLTDFDRFINEFPESYFQYRKIDFTELSDIQLETLYQKIQNKFFGFKVNNRKDITPTVANFQHKIKNKQINEIKAERQRRIDEGNYAGTLLESTKIEYDFTETPYFTLTIKDNG